MTAVSVCLVRARNFFKLHVAGSRRHHAAIQMARQRSLKVALAWITLLRNVRASSGRFSLTASRAAASHTSARKASGLAAAHFQHRIAGFHLEQGVKGIGCFVNGAAVALRARDELVESRLELGLRDHRRTCAAVAV